MAITQVRSKQQLLINSDVTFGNTYKITNLVDPTNPQDGATKAYVDAVKTGLDIKDSVRVASTAAITVTYNATGGTSTRGQITAAPNSIDGVTLAAGNRILLKDQSAGAQNGIWVVSTLGTGANGVWDRAIDFDGDLEVTGGAFTFVEEGTINQDSGWVLTNNNPITIGGSSGTALTWTQFSGAGQITAGNGLTKNANQLDVNPDGVTIEVVSDQVRVKDAGITYSKIQNTAAGQRLIGRYAASAGSVQEISLGTGLALDSGTGVLTATGSFTNPMTTLGDMMYGGNSGVLTRLANAGTTNGVYILQETVSGGAAGAPSWLGTTGSGNVVLATAPTIAGGTHTGLTSLGIRDTSAAFDVTIAAASSTALTAGRTLTIDLINASRTLKLAGNIDIAGNFSTSGAFGITLTATATTSVTLPTSGTLAVNPTTTIGDVIYASSSGTPGTLARLAGNTATQPAFLTSTGNGSANTTTSFTSSTGSGNVVLSTSASISTPTISGGTHTALTSLGIRDTSAAFDVTVAATSSTALTAARTLTIDMINAARTLKLGGNIDIAGNFTTAGAFTTSGAFPITLTATASTSVTLPTSGTLLSTVSYVVREVPSGTVNGSNATFTLANTPVSGTEQIYVNGVLQNAGSTNDYTISGTTITFTSGAIPQNLNSVPDVILVTYLK